MVQRDGQVVLKMLNDVKTKTITPVIKTQIKQYSKIYTDEYTIYNWLSDFYYHILSQNSQSWSKGIRS